MAPDALSLRSAAHPASSFPVATAAASIEPGAERNTEASLKLITSTIFIASQHRILALQDQDVLTLQTQSSPQYVRLSLTSINPLNKLVIQPIEPNENSGRTHRL